MGFCSVHLHEETGSLSKEETEHFANIEVLVKKFEDAMEDDFNTADAVSAIFEIVRESNSTVKDFSADYAKCSVSSLLKEPVSSLAAISLHRSIAVKIRSNPVFALSTKVSLKFNGVL